MITDLLANRLDAPSGGPFRAVLDTDAYNEIDDQFALAHALLAPDRIALEAVYAAPFVNERAADPGEGMERSLEEIRRVIGRIGRWPTGGVFPGSRAYLPGPGQPVESEAAQDLVARAHGGPDPLYVLAIGAPTNVASALLIDPDIAGRIIVVWLGGHGLHWPHTREFNFGQDVPATRHLLDCGVPLVLLPCMGVVQMLATTIPELSCHLGGRDGIAGYLLECVREFPGRPRGADPWHKVIWDVAATAWLINPAWCPSRLCPSPVFRDDFTWGPEDPSRYPIRYVREVKRDEIFADLFGRLVAASPPGPEVGPLPPSPH